MSEVKPWEQPPDEGYWRALLSEDVAPSVTQQPPPDAAPPAPPKLPEGWALAEKSYAQGDTLELCVVGYNRGGLLVDLGNLHGFVPASQLSAFPRQVQDDARMQELARYMHTMLRLKVIEFDRTRNRLILSERVASPPLSRADQALASIQPQQTRKGIVRNVTDFGAFVDLCGVEGLIHVSELSWDYVKHPRDVLSPGQEVDVYVVEVNREQKRVACSLKRLKPNPWREIAERFRPGDWITGVITSITTFGAFVRVADGVEGLIHASELAEENFLHPRDVVREGQSVQVRVIDIDSHQRRMRLSLRKTNVKKNLDKRQVAAGDDAPPPPPPDPGYWQSLAESGM